MVESDGENAGIRKEGKRRKEKRRNDDTNIKK